MRFIATALLLLASLAAQAADNRHFAVLSLIGDKILFAQYFPDAAGRLDSSDKQFVALEDDVLDKTALAAVDLALKRTGGLASKPVLLSVRDPALYDTQSSSGDTNATSRRLLERIAGLLKASGATHLILITKYRHEARIRDKDEERGAGSIEGLGFYIDAGPPLGATTGSPGMLAVFAYLRYQLVDVARGTVLKEETSLASKAYSVFRSETGDAWHSVTNLQKVQALQELVRGETARIVPNLVGGTANR